MAHRLSIALSAGEIFELGASEAFKERVVPLRFGVYSVGRPVPQHEEEVREPRRLAAGKQSKVIPLYSRNRYSGGGTLQILQEK